MAKTACKEQYGSADSGAFPYVTFKDCAEAACRRILKVVAIDRTPVNREAVATALQILAQGQLLYFRFLDPTETSICPEDVRNATAAIATTAVRQSGGAYLLSGEKIFATGAATATGILLRVPGVSLGMAVAIGNSDRCRDHAYLQ